MVALPLLLITIIIPALLLVHKYCRWLLSSLHPIIPIALKFSSRMATVLTESSGL